MKIGILTQPLRTNYGGLLQAYALQTILKRLGHEPIIINRCYSEVSNSILSKVLRIKNIMTGRDVVCNDIDKISFVEQNTLKFIQNRYNLTEPIYTTADLKKCIKYENLGAIIVGSDQVWRPRYSPNIFNYFLDFTEGEVIKRYSYAASFGVDVWEYNHIETKKCSQLAQLFNRITVREITAIDLCINNLKVEAELVLDPTLLLSKEDYINLLEDDIQKSSGELFTYILDYGSEKDVIIDYIIKSINYSPFLCMPKQKLTYKNAKKNIKDCQIPAVEQWIQSFVDAKMVVTDSFHGTAFSIIFNKPFWVIGNERRGNTRMESLLEIFGLKDRMVNEGNISTIDWNRSIDWKKVNDTKRKWQIKSMDFLTNL